MKPFAPVALHGRVRGLTFNPATQQWETLSTTEHAAALTLKLTSLRGSLSIYLAGHNAPSASGFSGQLSTGPLFRGEDVWGGARPSVAFPILQTLVPLPILGHADR